MIRFKQRGRAGSVAAACLLWLATSVAGRGQVVISQVYGGGGNSGALFRNDFVELFNAGENPVSVAGWAIQYASSGGTSWQVQNLQGQMEPGRHYLVQLASGGANGLALPDADTTGTINLSATGGKVALTRNAIALSGTCPEPDAIADLVGYGSSASCFEGAGPAPAPSATLAVFRAVNGCRDTGDNAADFFTSAPAPRNLAAAASSCGAAPARALHEIQGAGEASRFAGLTVTTTTNVVTAVVAEGFFLQARDGGNDSDAATSEGVFVSTPDGVPSLAVVGNAIVVTAFVEEFHPATAPGAPTRTQLRNPLIEWIATNEPLPSPVTIDAGVWSDEPSLADLERFEGMRVRGGALTVTGATEGFIQEASAVGISDGLFHAVMTGMNRPMREPGIPMTEALPAGAPAGVPRFDGNPERLRVDSNAQAGARRIEVVAGAVVSGLSGVLDFQPRGWTLLPDPSSAHTVTGNAAASPVAEPGTNEILIASLNLQRFFDPTEDPAVSEVVLSATAFAGRLKKASLTIREILRAPDVLGLLEIENLSTLQTLADQVNADLQATGRNTPRYAAWLEEGNDIGGIDCGFLVNTARLAVIEVTQVGRDASYLNPDSGTPELLNDRPPLLLRAEIPRGTNRAALPLTILLNHLRSLSGIDDPSDGVRVRAKRRAQAEFVANWAQAWQSANPAEPLLLMGDFNAFEFNDGYADVMGTITGRPAAAEAVVLASADLVEPDLINLTELLPAGERYSYLFDGNIQAIDHVLVNTTLRPRVARHGYARSNVDFPESYRSDFNRPERISDHDAAVVWIATLLAPRLEARPVSAGGLELRVSAEPGEAFRIESSVDLKVWTETGEGTTDASGRATFRADAASAGNGGRFFRVVLPQR